VGERTPLPEAPLGGDRSDPARQPAAITVAPPPRISGYRVLGEIGRGGMARVYRVVDESSGKELALKQLQLASDVLRKHGAALFEREFHMLVQLRHPCVIEVYDYGFSDAGPYYTMELLDGDDVRARSPMPWRQACTLLFDVCSSLALLHSRRLVHRDITPRNIRCTHEGSAKLIDFGALAPMGPGGHPVGTPAFIAPEVVHRSSLDGRTDVYSLGATLYYALTGRAPYRARHMADVLAAWVQRPPPPSRFAPDIPEELDRLVMSMMHLEPALRPRGAYEVMQRLRALAAIERDEPSSVSAAYLTSPVLVGRDDALATFRRQMERALQMRGSGVLVEAEAGLGRSRLLDAFALEAKLLGATVLRGSADDEDRGNLAVARSLAEQLIDAHPDRALHCARELAAIGAAFELNEPAPGTPPDQRAPPLSLRACPDGAAARLELQTVLAQWFLRISWQHPLLLAVDDVDRIDDPSMAVLAGLAPGLVRHGAMLAVTAESSARVRAAPMRVLDRHCTRLGLRALDRAETETLLCSMFGDVPNVALLAERIHSVGLGRPRESMALAQHLIERGTIAYSGGTWTLPQQLAASDLPLRAEDVFAARVAALTARARRLARMQSLSIFETFTREDFVALDPGADAAQVDDALSELLSHEIVRASGSTYTVTHRAVRDALQAPQGDAERVAMHAALADLYERTDRPAAGVVAHLLSAGQTDRALDLLMRALEAAGEPRQFEIQSTLPIGEVGRLLERALDACERLTRSRRERIELTRWVFLLSLVTEDRLHDRAGPTLLAQLEQDSGLAAWRELGEITDPMQRVLAALQRAGERYAATPEQDRVYPVDVAIRNLVYYVLISIAVGARTLNGPLIESLPGLLEPFAPLTPILHAMWQNALGTREMSAGRAEQAYARWLVHYEKLEKIAEADLPGVGMVRNAVAFALGSVDAQLGRAGVERWARLLDADPLQQVNAMYLRRTFCLHRGDFESAENFRRKAEVLAVQATVRQMFNSTLIVELSINALVRDLTGVKQVKDRIAPLAEQLPGWRPYKHLAEAHFQRLRGDLTAAAAECEQALALIPPDGPSASMTLLPWTAAATAYVEVLFELGRHEDARALAERALARCGEAGLVGVTHELKRLLALSEGKLGDLAGAAARLEALVETISEHTGPGLLLGASYESRARVAIWAGDRAAVERYAKLALHEYRRGRASALGARYELLMQEAGAAGVQPSLPGLESFASTHIATTALGRMRGSADGTATSALKRCDDAVARAGVALQLLCDANAARGGHLYVMRESGLELAASLGAALPDEQLRPLLAAYWQRQLADPDLPTAYLPEGPVEPDPSDQLWTDSRGTQYRPLLIRCCVEDAIMHVGVAVLIANAGPDGRPTDVQVAATVASHLLAAGDALGIQA
jgi:tetratricopeptide (TPR) repeat protein